MVEFENWRRGRLLESSDGQTDGKGEEIPVALAFTVLQGVNK
jgi:hypothetical protein